MVLIELELGHSQRLLRRASSLAHGRACLPISPKTTRQLAISDHQGHSEAIRGHQLACESLSSRCLSNEGGNQEAINDTHLRVSLLALPLQRRQLSLNLL